MCWWYDRVACFMGRCTALRKLLGIVFLWRTRGFRAYSCVGYLWCVVRCDLVWLHIACSPRTSNWGRMQCPFLRGGFPSIFNDMKANQVHLTFFRLIRLPIDEFGVLPYCWLWLMRSRVEDHTIVRIPCLECDVQQMEMQITSILILNFIENWNGEWFKRWLVERAVVFSKWHRPQESAESLFSIMYIDILIVMKRSIKARNNIR